jgi:hypothetical protein
VDHNIQLSGRCSRQNHKDIHLKQLLLVILVPVSLASTALDSADVKDQDTCGMYLNIAAAPELDQILATVHQTPDCHLPTERHGAP